MQIFKAVFFSKKDPKKTRWPFFQKKTPKKLDGLFFKKRPQKNSMLLVILKALSFYSAF